MPPFSPRTQALMQPPPTGEDAKALFEDGFSQMAQNVLNSRFPDLVSQVVTFQVLSSDLDSGSGVGVFVLSRNGKTVQVPVILANNQIKPMEIMFVKDDNVFLPLQRGWLEEVDRANIDELGEGVKPPKDMVTDMDIRNLVVPPAAGRYTYASAPGSKLVDFLHRAPNYVKKAFHKVLTTNRKILKFAVEHYDMEHITEALIPRVEKTAAEPVIRVLTLDTPPKEFKQTFGKLASEAFQFATKHGYVVKDDREFFKVALETEEAVWLHTAKEPGFYRLTRADGSHVDAVVVPNPRALTSRDRHGKSTGTTPLPDQYAKRVQGVPATQEVHGISRYPGADPKFLIFTENRDIIVTDTPPVGKMIPEPEVNKKLLDALRSDGAGSGYGVFVRYEAGKVSATVPISITHTATGSDGLERRKTDSIFDDPNGYGPKTIVTDPKSPIRQIVAPRDCSITYMPHTFKFVTGTRADYDFIKAAQGTDVYGELLKKAGASRVRLVNAHGGMFGIGRATPQTKLATLKQLVINLGLREPEARLLLEKTATKSYHNFYLVSPVQLVKFAMLCKQAQPPPMMDPTMDPTMYPTMDPAMAQQMGAVEAPPPEADAEGAELPPEEGGMPPEMAGGVPPEMMAPPMPPPPDPVQIAVTEIGSQLAGQAAEVAKQLAEQQRDLSNQLAVLDAVQQRAQQVAAEQAGMPPLPPEAEVGAPPQAAMPPPGTGPGPVPTAPPVEEPMPVEQPMAAEQLAQQAMPPMEQATELAPYGAEDSADAFEATAIGSMATNPDLRGVISTYLPALEDALDHMARILLSLWIQEDEYRAELGEKDFSELEERMRTVFNNLGQLVLRINQTAMAAKPENEMVAQS